MTEAAPAIDENMPPLDDVNDDVTTEATKEVSATPESAPAPDSEPVAEPTEEDGVQKRINKITADKYAEKRRADALEKRLSELEAQNKAPEAAEPKLEDFDFDETQHTAALVKYHSQKAVSEAVSNIKTEQKQETDDQRQTEISNGFNVKVDEFRKEAPDYDNVIGGLPDLPGDVMDAIMTHDKGPQLAHYLGKHLDVAENITLMKLGEISAQLATKPITKAPSAAPEPIEPVKPGGSLNKDQSEMSMDEIYSLE